MFDVLFADLLRFFVDFLLMFVDVWWFLMIFDDPTQIETYVNIWQKGTPADLTLTGSTPGTVAWFVLEHHDSEAMNVSSKTIHF